jgi:hypothetical protein
MRHTAFTLVLGCLLATGLSAADPRLVNMVMPEAKVIAGINVDSARNSPFGSFLIRQTAGNAGDLQKFVEITGFNPQTDLNEILMATLGSEEKPALAGTVTDAPPADPAVPEKKRVRARDMHGLILARGTFNIEKITALAQTDGKQKIQTYNGATLIQDPRNMHASAMAFIGNNIAVIGDLASVKAAIDRRDLPNNLDPQLTNKMNALSASQDLWAVSIAPFATLNTGPVDPMFQGALNGDLFKKITTTSGGIKLGSQIQLSTEVEAMDEKNATALGDVVKFLAGMATMNAGGAKGAPPAVANLLQTLTVQTQGKVVSVTMTAPEDQIETLLNSMHGPAKSGASI